MHPISQGAKNELIDLFSKIPNGPFGIVTAMSIVESFPTSEPENRWIPVTERLPEICVTIMFVAEGSVRLGHYNTHIKKGWRDFDSGDFFENVEKWQPVPSII